MKRLLTRPRPPSLLRPTRGVAESKYPSRSTPPSLFCYSTDPNRGPPRQSRRPLSSTTASTTASSRLGGAGLFGIPSLLRPEGPCRPSNSIPKHAAKPYPTTSSSLLPLNHHPTAHPLHLIDPSNYQSDFIDLARAAVGTCEASKRRLVAGEVAPGVETVRELDGISNTLCLAIDAAELARNVHHREVSQCVRGGLLTDGRYPVGRSV